MDNLKISIIISVYNSAKTIKETLESIYGSDYPNYEVIVVDDCSADDTVKIVNEFPCRLIRSERHTGNIATARNRGSKEAKGEILLFVDSDMILERNTLTLFARSFKDPKVHGVVGLVSKNTKYENFYSNYKNLWMHYTFSILPNGVGAFLTCTSAVRKHAFYSINGFDENYVSSKGTFIPCEDTDLGQKLATHGYKTCVNKEIEFEHIKYYSLKSLLRTDFERSCGETKGLLRNLLNKTKRRKYTSVPSSFIISVVLFCIYPLLLVTAFFAQNLLFLLKLVPVLLCAILLLNFSFLNFLRRTKGFSFFVKSCLFIFIDILVAALGVWYAIFDFMRGETY